MIAVLVNTLTVLLGSTIGMVAGRGIPPHISDGIMKGVALCVLYIGIDGMLEGSNAIIAILSMVVGILIGELCDLDGRLNRFSRKLEARFRKKDGGRVTLAEGFVTGSLLFCVGAMSVVGSLQSGMTGNHEMIFTKSALDFCSSLVLASTLGLGVAFSAVFVLLYQGALTLLAGWVAPFFSDLVVAEMTCVGSLLIIALGLNMLGICKLKVMNQLPAVFLPIAVVPLFQLLGL